MTTSPPETKSQSSTLSSIVNRLAGTITHLPPGDRADLRRARPEDPANPAFWKLAIDQQLLAGRGSDEEGQWVAILAAMARLEGLHQPGFRMGKALAEAGLSELRLVRLLRAEGGRLFDELRAVVQFLSSKAVGVDCVDLARLVLSDGRSDQEDVRRRIARDYFSNLEA